MTSLPASIASRVARAEASKSHLSPPTTSTISRPSARRVSRYAASCASPLLRRRSPYSLGTYARGRVPRATSSASVVRCGHST